ncbi:MAG: hypothetical protein U0822_26095 [Anaerolineae bacterium]
MRTFKRVLAVIVIVISALFLLVNIAGLIGVWWAETTAVSAVADVVQITDNIFQRAQTRVDQLNTRVGEAQQGVRNLETELRNAGDKVTDTNLVLATVTALTDKDVTPSLDRLQTASDNFNETLDDLDRTLRMLDRLTAGGSRMGDVVDKLRGAISSIRDLQQDLRDMRQALQDKKAETVAQLVDRLSAPIQRVDNRLGVVQGRLTTVSSDITEGRARLVTLQSRVDTALLLLAIAFTLVILWGILALIALILYAIAFLTGRDPIRRWYATEPATTG